ncbi:hypothetical protein V6N12_050763 [Hibiscus sabdariffa]|uniref:RNase H type-1 domain-containing protein n=1 Tax=Hibiscus sabdariffa TaxID=183260 RepID=A0ABR2GDI7_9ROSI
MPMSDEAMLHRSITWAGHYHGCAMVSNLGTIVPRLVPQAWTPSVPGWVCLSVDGGMSLSSGKVRIGGPIRNVEDDWIVWFVKSIGFSNSLQAELWAIFEGMKLA